MPAPRAPHPVRLRFALACALSAVAAGCGQAVQVRRGGTLRVVLIEFRLDPDSVHARAGRLSLIATNKGRLTHDLVISLNGRTLAATRPLAPGRSGTTAVRLSPGTYQMSSSMNSDEPLGMYGTLTITR